MEISEELKIKEIALHSVGNKANSDMLRLSHSSLNVGEDIMELLSSYFLSPFKSGEYFNLYHETDLKYNEVYGFVSDIFDDPETLFEQSVNLAKHLYEKSVHPKVKPGEFYTVYFKDLIIDGITADAIGLFKSENKDTFLKVFPSGDGFNIESQQGVNINKLDKGCLIYNTESENGYIVSVVDNTNKSAEAQYWMDDFLHVRQRKDEYYNTQNLLSLCKTFVTKELPQQFDVSKADQVDFLNKSVKFFKEKETFEMDEFADEVISQHSVIESFKRFKNDFQRENDIQVSDSFSISETAVKKQARAFKSVIKLDKNFHIYIHGKRELIEQGVDADGRKYYKIYYKEEN
jgi:hypothetical protein